MEWIGADRIGTGWHVGGSDRIGIGADGAGIAWRGSDWSGADRIGTAWIGKKWGELRRIGLDLEGLNRNHRHWVGTEWDGQYWDGFGGDGFD